MHIHQETFDGNLLLTQAYCELQLQKSIGNSAEVLRSFNPQWKGKPLFSFRRSENNSYHWTDTVWSTDPLLGGFYSDLFAEQLQHKRRVVNDEHRVNSVYKGRILVSEIYETVVDGASEAISEGFVDGNDCPPIDTWFYMEIGKGNYPVLFTWVPERFVKLANEAIEVNCMNLLHWYDGDLDDLYGKIKQPYIPPDNDIINTTLNSGIDNKPSWFIKLLRRFF